MFSGRDLDTGKLVITADIDPNSDPIGHPAQHDPPWEDPLEAALRARSDAELLSCRGCGRVEQPAAMLRHPLVKMQLRLSDGLLVHPDEQVQLDAWRRDVYDEEEARRQRAASAPPTASHSTPVPPPGAGTRVAGEADELRSLLRGQGDRQGGYIELLRRRTAEIELAAAPGGRVVCVMCGEPTSEPAAWNHNVSEAACRACSSQP